MRALLFATSMLLASAPAMAEEKWVSCVGCGAGSAATVANQAAPPLLGNGTSEHTVYVLNNAARAIFKFEVVTDREPGFYNRSVSPVAVEAHVSTSLGTFWARAASIGNLDVPTSESPSASDYLANPYYSGRTRNWLATGGQGLIAQINGAIFTATVSANQGLAALGADRGAIVLTLNFPDGSTIQVEVTIGTNGLGGEPVITEVKVVPNSAYDAAGVPLPTSSAGFNNYAMEGPSEDTLRHFLRLAASYGIPVVRVCGGSRARWRCDAAGRCTMTVTASC